MNSEQFKQPYIEHADFSFMYSPIPDIEREIVSFEDGLKNNFEQRAQLTRVPRETNPLIPRFFFQNKSQKKLEVAVVKSTLSFKFPGQPINKVIKIFTDNSKDIFTFLKSKKNITLESLISNIQIRYPLKNLEDDIISDIQKRFLNITFEGDIINSAFSFKIFKNGSHFEYFIGSYSSIKHTINFDTQKHQNETAFYKLSDKNGVLTERGLSFGIVVSNEFDMQNTGSLVVGKYFNEILENCLNEIEIAPKKILFARQ